MPVPAGSPVYRVLGPLEAEAGGTPVPLPAGRQRVLLATLLLRANRTVSIAELIEKLWDRSIPVNARGTVQKHIMRLRRTIGHGPIRTEQDGYRIEIGPGQLDLDRFGELVKQGTRAAEDGQPAVAAAAFGEALALWRGLPPLANVPSESLHRHEVPQLLERYVRTLERRIEADLLLGRHGELVGELMALVGEHPLRERFWVQLMRALYGTGRQGEALEAYREVVRLLADELGIAPGAELRAVHQEILRGTPIEAHPVVRQPVRQLPMAIPGFVGRQAEMARIGEILRPDTRTGLPVVVVTGPAGVGKTTLAVHAAHQVAERFPDGQLFADLRAYAGAAPVTVEQVLGQFLRALGLPADAVPLQIDDQIVAYRSLLADRKALVLLDNVRNEAQVRALLPGGAGCAVLITSRNELAGLAVAPGAERRTLAMLTAAEAHQLLEAVVGPARLAADPQATGELIELCGGLALALRVAAAHLQLRPALSLPDYVEQLRRHGPVETLKVDGDHEANLAAAFDWSYRQLPPEQQRVLRLLSLIPGPDVNIWAVAALCDGTAAAAGSWLERLAAANLLTRVPPSRYRLHDLIRGYAALRCQSKEPKPARDAARRRLFDHYLNLVDAAVRPHLELARLPRPQPDPATLPRPLTLELLDEERPALVAAVRDAAEHGPDDAAYHLADALRGYFTLRGHAVDWHTVATAGLAAAHHAGSDEAVAAMLNSKGALGYYTGDTQPAHSYLTAALEIYERLGSPAANAVRVNLGILAETSSDLESAVKHHHAALIGYQDAGDPIMEQRARENLVLALLAFGDLAEAQREGAALAGVARQREHLVLGILAMITQHTGDLREAAGMLREAATAAAADGDHRTEVGLLALLAGCSLELGQDEQAYRIATSALARAEQEDPRNVAQAATQLGGAVLRAGQPDRARGHSEHALRAARGMRDVDCECGALIGLARVELSVGALDAARGRATEAVATARGSMRRLRLAQALPLLAACHRLRNEPDHARQAIAEAALVAEHCHYPLGQAQANAELGNLQLASGDRQAAERSWRAALRVYSRIGSYRQDELAKLLGE